MPPSRKQDKIACKKRLAVPCPTSWTLVRKTSMLRSNKRGGTSSGSNKPFPGRNRQMNGKESDSARAERLARRQAQAAGEAEQMAKKGQEPLKNPNAQGRQRQISDEAKQLRAGEQGQVEKQKAMEALAQTEKAGNPDE